MYKISKEAGNNANVTLRNTETNAEIIIGRLSMDLLDALERDGYSFEKEGEKSLRYKDEWELDISDDIGKDIGKLAMKISKPIAARVSTKTKAKNEQPKRNKQPVDVFNLIFGIED